MQRRHPQRKRPSTSGDHPRGTRRTTAVTRLIDPRLDTWRCGSEGKPRRIPNPSGDHPRVGRRAMALPWRRKGPCKVSTRDRSAPKTSARQERGGLGTGGGESGSLPVGIRRNVLGVGEDLGGELEGESGSSNMQPAAPRSRLRLRSSIRVTTASHPSPSHLGVR